MLRFKYYFDILDKSCRFKIRIRVADLVPKIMGILKKLPYIKQYIVNKKFILHF